MKKLYRSIFYGLYQIRTYFVGEVKEIFRDGGTVVIFLLAMIAYPIVYSLGYINELAKDVPVAVVDLNNTDMSRKLCRMMDATEQIKITYKVNSIKEAEALFYKNNLSGVVLINKDFEKNILSGKQGGVTVYSDAGHFLLYKQVYSGVLYASQTLGAGIEIRNLLTKGKTLEQAMEQRDPLSVKATNLYNPYGGYATFIVPGILIVIIQQTLLIGIGILGGKHNERKSFHYLKEGARRPFEAMKIILGQTLAFILIYLITTLLILGVFYKLIHFPDKSNFINTYFLLIPYLATISFLGISLSLLFPKRVYALLFLVFISPTLFFISGAAWPVEALPAWLHNLSYIIPSTPMVNAFIKVRIMGTGLQSVKPEYSMMLIQMLVYFAIAIIIYRIKLRKLRAEME
jgi:ABC-2 type transport system permease protein